MNYLTILFVLLLTAPATAQVVPSPFGGNAGGGGGGGGGSVTSVGTTSPITGGTITTTGTIACTTCTTNSSSFTTGVVPMGTAAHTLGDSSNAVMPGTNGSLGFNQGGNAEAVIGTASLGNAGVFIGGPSIFTVHDSAAEPGSQLLIYNDVQGITNGIALDVYGAHPNNNLNFIFGDGAGGGDAGTIIFGPSSVLFNLANTSGLGIFQFSVDQGLSGDHNVMITAQKNIGSFIQVSNTLDTAVGQVSTNLLNGPTGTHILTSMDALDATGDVSVGVYSPTANGGIGAVKIGNTQTGAGTAAQLHLLSPGGLHGVVAFKSPDVVTGDATTVYTLPVAFPAANGQPLVSTTAGVMSFAAGKTQAYVVCTGAACATSCTLTFTGGILTANSGTCP